MDEQIKVAYLILSKSNKLLHLQNYLTRSEYLYVHDHLVEITNILLQADREFDYYENNEKTQKRVKRYKSS